MEHSEGGGMFRRKLSTFTFTVYSTIITFSKEHYNLVALHVQFPIIFRFYPNTPCWIALVAAWHGAFSFVEFPATCFDAECPTG